MVSIATTAMINPAWIPSENDDVDLLELPEMAFVVKGSTVLKKF